jgi:signal transduction histidine kinase
LTQGTSEPWLGGFLPASPVWLLPLLGLFLTVLVAVGPLVARIRRLTAAVRRSAASEYHVGVAETGRDELGELGRAFDEAAAAVRAQLAETRRSETALREFLANTTHDVMIPLTVLKGHLAALQAQLAAAGPAGPAGEGPAPAAGATVAAVPGSRGATESAASASALRQTVVQAMNEAHYVGALLHNLSTVAKLDASDAFVHIGPVDLGALVERVVQRHLPLSRSLSVSLDRAVPAEPLTLPGDVTLLEQAVGNLVGNALRYNRPGGHVAVVLEPVGPAAVDPAGPPSFRLCVLDDGPGIAPADLDRLRARGARGDHARRRAPDGRGLGLHIAARVAELHGLHLRFLPAEGGGLRVELTPQAPPPAHEEAPGAAAPGPAPREEAAAASDRPAYGQRGGPARV